MPLGTRGVADAVLEPRPRIGFVSLGCPKNLVDSEVMMGLLDRAGAEMTNRPETADILVVNTCSFIDKAKQESIDTILQMAEHKVSGKARKLIVAGCLVERYRDEIRKNMPEVDAVVGTGELEAILAAAGLDMPSMPRRAPSQSPQLFPFSPAALPGLKAICASPRGVSRGRSGKARRPGFRSIFTTTPRRGCWPRRSLRPTSRSPRAATIPVVSALSPISAANFARGVLNQWSPKPNSWSRRGCANSR